MIRSEQINLVAIALVKAQSEMGNAFKGSANPFFKSKYADLNSIREACLPALFANALSVIQPTVVIDGKNYIETLIVHESGQFLGGHTEIIFAKQNDAQNFGAGTTYARRFGLQALLCVGADDSDGEEAVGRGKTIPKTNIPHHVPNVSTNTNTTTSTNILISNGTNSLTQLEKSNIEEQNKGAIANEKLRAEALNIPKKGFGVVKKTEVPVVQNKATTDAWE